MRIIPVCEPSLSKLEEDMVLQAIRENQISSSAKYVSMFEAEFAGWLSVSAEHAVAVNSGGSALFLALKALGTGEGDEVIVPDFTMVAVANAVVQCGAVPVFVDCEKDTGNMDPNFVERLINRKTKAIIVVHIYGHPCSLSDIGDVANRHNLFLVEDCAEAHGALYGGKKVGTFGDMSCFSFYANKIITTGEGGMVVVKNHRNAKIVRHMRGYWFGEKNRFLHGGLGWNLRMSSLEAAMGLAQLRRVEELIKGRRDNALYYRKELAYCPEVEFLAEKWYAKPVYWMVGILAEEKSLLRHYLWLNGVETRDFFVPMHIQPHLCFEQQYKSFPNSRYLSRKGLYLPSSSHLSIGDKERVVKLIKKFYSN